MRKKTQQARFKKKRLNVKNGDATFVASQKSSLVTWIDHKKHFSLVLIAFDGPIKESAKTQIRLLMSAEKLGSGFPGTASFISIITGCASENGKKTIFTFKQP